MGGNQFSNLEPKWHQEKRHPTQPAFHLLACYTLSLKLPKGDKRETSNSSLLLIKLPTTPAREETRWQEQVENLTPIHPDGAAGASAWWLDVTSTLGGPHRIKAPGDNQTNGLALMAATRSSQISVHLHGLLHGGGGHGNHNTSGNTPRPNPATPGHGENWPSFCCGKWVKNREF